MDGIDIIGIDISTSSKLSDIDTPWISALLPVKEFFRYFYKRLSCGLLTNMAKGMMVKWTF